MDNEREETFILEKDSLPDGYSEFEFCQITDTFVQNDTYDYWFSTTYGTPFS